MQLWMPNINMTNIKNIFKKKLKLQPALKSTPLTSDSFFPSLVYSLCYRSAGLIWPCPPQSSGSLIVAGNQDKVR